MFISENETNALALPACPRSLVIFGLGYRLGRLSTVVPLREVAAWGREDVQHEGRQARLTPGETQALAETLNPDAAASR